MNWPSRNDHSYWLGRKATKQTNKPDYIRASTQDFGTIAQMRPLNMWALSYCGAKDLLCEIHLDVYKSSKVSSEALCGCKFAPGWCVKYQNIAHTGLFRFAGWSEPMLLTKALKLGELGRGVGLSPWCNEYQNENIALAGVKRRRLNWACAARWCNKYLNISLAGLCKGTD